MRVSLRMVCALIKGTTSFPLLPCEDPGKKTSVYEPRLPPDTKSAGAPSSDPQSQNRKEQLLLFRSTCLCFCHSIPSR